MSEEVFRKKYGQLHELDGTITKIKEHLEQLNTQLLEFSYAEQSLKQFQNIIPGTEILAQVVNGIFAKAELKQSSMVRVNVGNNVMVDKPVKEAQEVLSAQVKEIEQAQKHLQQQFSAYMKEFQSVQEELQQLAKNNV